jgi:phosphoserine phosphatase RsbX
VFNADCHVIARAMTGFDDECGDVGVVVKEPGGWFAALADVLGHGGEAFQEAEKIKAFLIANHELDLGLLMAELHAHLRGGRGAVVTLCRFDAATGKLAVVGVGNITARLFADEAVRIAGRDGIVGYSMPTPKRHEAVMFPGDVLMLYSDGVREQFDIFDRPGLLVGNAAEISRRVLDAFAKGDDDASCLVLRCAA